MFGGYSIFIRKLTGLKTKHLLQGESAMPL